MNSATWSESEMREELRRQGVQCNGIANGDLDTLQKMILQHFRENIGSAENASNQTFNQRPGPETSADNEKKLREEVEAKRRYLELIEEMARLNDAILATGQMPVQQGHAVRQPVFIPGNVQRQLNPTRIKAADMENVVDVFTGDDQYSVNSFINDFEAASRQFGLTEEQMSIYAKRFVRGTAKTLLRTVQVNTWVDIRRELQTEFAPAITTASIHKKLAKRRKQPNETVLQYSVVMREIAANAHLEEIDVIGYIVDGVARDKNERLFLSGANNYNELRLLLHRYQDMLSNLTDRPTITKLQDENSNGRTVNVATRKQLPKCFNCNEIGHYSAKCEKPKRTPYSCFKCGSAEHMQDKCPLLQTQLKKEIANVDTADNDEEYNFIETVSLFLSNKVSKTSVKINARMDTASPISFVQERFIPPEFLESMCSVSERHFGLNGSPMGELGVLNVSILFRNRLTNRSAITVVKNGTMLSAAIIGRDFMKRAGLSLVFKDEPKRESEPIISSGKFNEFNKNLSEIMSIDTTASVRFEINPKLENSHLDFISALVESSCYEDHYQLSSPNIELNIRLTSDAPFHCSPRRLSVAASESIREILERLLKQGVIRPSHSPYSSPVVLVKKKCGALRMCVDYRALNKITARDNYPLPLIEDQIDSLHQKRYFTCLDLKDGFHHVRVAAGSVKYTSFVTPLGQYEFLRMPFGLRNAPSVFQRYINSIFRPLIDAKKILIYMDDILIATVTLDEHLQILKEVFAVIKENSLTLKLSKCKFLFEEIDYLGYRINKEGIQPNPRNVEAIKGFPVPKNSRDVHSFLGLASYFRKFIRNFATIAKPLYDLIRKDAVFQWGPTELTIFNQLKKILLSQPVLAIYSPTDPTELHCDASSLGYGAILMQRKSDKQWHPVFFFSKRTTDAESRFHSFELETLAIINALKRFRIYLEGIQFTIVTDCNSLALTLNKKQVNPRIARWALELENYDYNIVHRGNERMRHVDALSRNTEILVIEANSFEQVLAVEQGRDPQILQLRSELEAHPNPLFELSDGLVYKKSRGDKLLFYVPACMEDNVIRSCHDQMGHFGTDKVQNLLTKFYWFPRMKLKVQAYIQKCLRCIQFSPNSGKVEGDLHSIPKGKFPFDTIHIDHIGPLETTKNKKKHIFLIVDGFTKFVKLYAVRTTSSKEAIVCLTSYFEIFSRPLRIVSDRGTCFTSQEFSEFVKENNISHIKVATASPQSNGQAERMNRIITPMLAKISENADWNKKLNQIEFNMNNTVCRSTGTSPSILLFGVDQRGEFCDKIAECLATKVEVSRDLVEIRNEASNNIKSEQNKNKVYFDSRHKQPSKYKVNDLVMVSNYDTTPGVNKKLLPKYRGPYRVAEVFPNDRYRIVDVENWQITQRPYDGIHAPAQMRSWVPPRE